MAKRRTTTVHFTVRLKDDTARAVAHVARECAWSDSKALQFLADVGANAIQDPKFDPEVARKIFNAWSQRATAQARADQLVREAQAAVRAVLRTPAQPPRPERRRRKLSADNQPKP
jgi:hypothetical protein